jgi:glutathione S-transferase
MKLYHVQNSPYARRARLAARASGFSIEEINVAPLGAPDSPLASKGPGGKVPALETDGGTLICETLIITNYLNQKSNGKLMPGDAAGAEAVLELEGVGSLLMDSLFERAHENRREDS